MSKRSRDLLVEDMLEAISKIENYTFGLSSDQFHADAKTADAVVRNLEIIGEAAGRLPKEFHAHFPDVEWSKIIGLRHRIVHDYFGIDLGIIWTILQRDLPAFKAALRKKPIS